ncbi:DUF6364 family protein [Wenzhouxiangella sp. EGI_FJ10409]|uniref:DUF6364 family protein n=1 Tax=Wenzhouxiangella sp. EGI_FJ10409 TaxID=3243767 RepID=UPI0035D6ECC2
MSTETTKLTIRIPVQDALFAKQYAQEHGITVTEVIDRYLRQLRELEGYSPSTDLEQITGLIPSDIDAEDIYRQHQLDKHR